MKAVVTGGAGFIGSHLVDLLLENNYSVTVIDNLSTGRLKNIEHALNLINFIEADLSIMNSTWIEHIRTADYIFHLASLADIVPSIENPISYFQSNVTATANILGTINARNIKKFVYAASSSCYGIAKYFPTNESHPISPEYPYAMTKWLGEELVLHWTKVYGLSAVSTRFFNVYGTRSRTSGTYGAVFGVFLAQKLASKPFTVVGDGTQMRDFTYVSDVCRGMLLAAESNISGEIFNIGSGKPHSINKLVQLLGGDVVNISKRPGEPEKTHADITKAREILGYKPVVNFETGVDKVLANIEYWAEAPVWTPESINKATQEWFDRLS
ncbi:polysaccharide biosynthesis family protein [Synechococcus sp. PROS-U-1]|nr:polysaccharide biosynthesis family protein [Synechococcus sp. PROS-U-1]